MNEFQSEVYGRSSTSGRFVGRTPLIRPPNLLNFSWFFIFIFFFFFSVFWKFELKDLLSIFFFEWYCFSFSDQVRELFSTDVLVERDISIIWMKVESMFEQRVEIERTVVTEWRIVSIAMFDWIQRVFFIIVECNAWIFYSATLECVELIVISCCREVGSKKRGINSFTKSKNKICNRVTFYPFILVYFRSSVVDRIIFYSKLLSKLFLYFIKNMTIYI